MMKEPTNGWFRDLQQNTAKWLLKYWYNVIILTCEKPLLANTSCSTACSSKTEIIMLLVNGIFAATFPYHSVYYLCVLFFIWSKTDVAFKMAWEQFYTAMFFCAVNSYRLHYIQSSLSYIFFDFYLNYASVYYSVLGFHIEIK